MPKPKKNTANGNTAERPIEPDRLSHAAKSPRLTWVRDRWWAVAIVAFLALGVAGAIAKYLDQDAARQARLAPGKRTALYALNPFVPAPTATPAQRLGKEYIYAGSSLLAVEDPGADTARPADLAVWRTGTSGAWYVMGPGGTIADSAWWGTLGDVPAPGDYDGDGKTDFCFYRPSTGAWHQILTATSTTGGFYFGTSEDRPAIGDYDGDGKSDPAFFRPSNGTWYWLKSGTTYPLESQQFGVTSDIPASADYDGDGRTDICVYRPGNTGAFHVLKSSTNSYLGVSFGSTGAQPVSGDYDGDGKADYAVLTGNSWSIYSSIANTTGSPITWQNSSDIPVPNDYDGDGKCDIAVWRDSNGDWYIRKSGSSGALRQEHWGQSGDIPVPAYYRR